MTSNINTGTINVNFPTPGVNNNSQGFRDNFASIKNSLDTAALEISDLENKVILKSPLTGTPLNNDMANAKISNALVHGFRASTYNLGNNLSNTLVIDVTNGDVQYGSITADTQIQFAKWAPTGTQCNVQLILNVANTSATLNFPTNVVYGAKTLENFLTPHISAGGSVGMPTEESQIHYVFSSIDCGTSVTVNQVNRPRQATQIEKRIVTAQIGRIGDRAGDVCIGAGREVSALTIIAGGTAYSAPSLVISPPDVDGGVQATGTLTMSGGIITGYTITTRGSGYLRSPSVTISDSTGHGAQLTSTLANITNYMYYCGNDYDGTTNIWNKVAIQAW